MYIRAYQSVFSTLRNHIWSRSTLCKRKSYVTRSPVTPLRVLYCGSDEFSSAALRALHDEHLRDPRSIASIDVLCRPGKPSGRGLKNIRDVPIKGVAKELGLRLHERDSFKGWKLPTHDGELINLIIAVSFGLFIPSRILNSAKFGGINVHPSLLPDFRGAAPLQRTLLAGEERTGVTLQTLDTKKFDHGRILAQDSFTIPNANTCTYPELLEIVTPKAAALLIKGIRERKFESYATAATPDVSWPNDTSDQAELRIAPKITPQDRRICLLIDKDDILRRDRVLGRLWCLICTGQRRKRMVLHGIESVQVPQHIQDALHSKEMHADISHLKVLADDGESFTRLPFMLRGDHIILFASPSTALLVKELTIEGERRMPAARALDGVAFEFEDNAEER